MYITSKIEDVKKISFKLFVVVYEIVQQLGSTLSVYMGY